MYPAHELNLLSLDRVHYLDISQMVLISLEVGITFLSLDWVNHGDV